MLERRRGSAGLSEQVLIRGVAGEQHPVRYLQQCAHHLSAQTHHRVEHVGHRGEHDDAGDRGNTGREKASKPSAVEPSEVDGPGLVVFVDEQAGDQVPGQREEDRHTEVAAAESRGAGMEEQYRHHRQRPHSVERWLVLEST